MTDRGVDRRAGARKSVGTSLRPVTASFSLKDHAYRLLRGALMEMDIYGEDVDLRLDERTLAERLGISRTPVREAIAMLAQEGFVEIRARRGVFVKLKTLDEVLDMVVVWAGLESMAAHLVTSVATDAEIRSLRALGTKHGTDSGRADIAEYSQANIRFHQCILELSRCALIRSTAEGLLQHLYAVRRRAMGESDRVSHSVVDHMAIIEAIENREGDLAASLVRAHTMRLHDHIRDTWLAREHDEARGRRGVHND